MLINTDFIVLGVYIKLYNGCNHLIEIHKSQYIFFSLGYRTGLLVDIFDNTFSCECNNCFSKN